MDKSLIINELKKFYSIKKDVDFAKFLGVSQQNLAAWRNRNTYNLKLLIAKCNEINPTWLATGAGEMLKNCENHQPQPQQSQQTEQAEADSITIPIIAWHMIEQQTKEKDEQKDARIAELKEHIATLKEALDSAKKNNAKGGNNYSPTITKEVNY